MIRRGLLTLLVATMGLGLVAAHDPLLTRADSQYYISNISVGVAGSTVTYDACVFAPVAAQGGMVVVSTQPDGSGNPYQVVLDPAGGCGGPTYALQGSATLPAGHYYFQAAYVFLAPGGPLLPAVQRNVGFVSNFTGDTVATDCQVDFTTGAPLSPQNCAGPGVVGNLVGFGPAPPAPTNTPLPTATPTNTAVPPTATNTPVPPAPTSPPAATTTPVPPAATNTPVPPAATSTGGGAPQPPAAPQPPTATNTPVPPAATNTPQPSNSPGSAGPGAAQPTTTPAAVVVVNAGSVTVTQSRRGQPSTHRTPHPTPTTHKTTIAAHATGPAPASALRASVLEPLVRPGTVQQVDVAYLALALVQATVTFPGAGAVSAYSVTDSHGHATLAVWVPWTVRLHNGRATAQVLVRGVAGPWHWLTTLAPVVQPGSTRQLTVSASPNTPVRAVVTIPGMRPFTLFGITGSHGRLTLTLTVPRSVTFRAGHATALVAVATVAPRRQAQVRRTLAISDMVVGLASSPIVSCWQMQTVHVAYYAHAPLRIVLLFPHGQHLSVDTRTDGLGNALAQVRLHYVRADSPVRIVVQASDATRGAHRMEGATVSVLLPQECQKAKAPVPTVTVGG